MSAAILLLRLTALLGHASVLPILFSNFCLGEKRPKRVTTDSPSIEIVPTSIPVTIVHNPAEPQSSGHCPMRHKLGYWCVSRGSAPNSSTSELGRWRFAGLGLKLEEPYAV